jgi:hypothetical protein
MKNCFKKKIMSTASIQKIVSISLLSFILAFLLSACDCHNAFPSLPSCSICKVNASISGTFSKYKIVPSDIMAVQALSMALFLLFFAVVPSHDVIVIDARIAFPFSNKAPPAR